jgi:hypothetical protein
LSVSLSDYLLHRPIELLHARIQCVLGLGDLMPDILIRNAHFVQLGRGNPGINSRSEKRATCNPSENHLLAIGLVAMGFGGGFFVLWYAQERKLRWYFPLCLYGCFGCIAYGTYLLLQ